MKQKITRFEKSTPRQLAFLFVGVGFIGLALTVGDNLLGFGLGSTAAWIMLGGFVLATLFLAIAGGAPVPSGTEDVEVEDRVTVQQSEELQGEIKSKVDAAINEMNEKFEASLSKMSQSADSLVERVESVSKTLEDANLSEVVSQLSRLAKDIDVESTTEALDALKTSVSSVTSNLDELSNLSASETEKIESSVGEISENLETTKTEINEKLNQLSSSMAEVEQELNKTLKQFEQFNELT